MYGSVKARIYRNTAIALSAMVLGALAGAWVIISMIHPR
jgi:hypothetical protein